MLPFTPSSVQIGRAQTLESLRLVMVWALFCPLVSVDYLLMAQLGNFRLDAFRAAAEHLDCHKAAEQLFLTQPAVTLQIKALGSDLGVRLFDRAGGKVSLTRQVPFCWSTRTDSRPRFPKRNESWAAKNGKVSEELSVEYRRPSRNMCLQDC